MAIDTVVHETTPPADFVSLGDALDQAVTSCGPNISATTLEGLEQLLEEAISNGLADPHRGVIEDFIANHY